MCRYLLGSKLIETIEAAVAAATPAHQSAQSTLAANEYSDAAAITAAKTWLAGIRHALDQVQR